MKTLIVTVPDELAGGAKAVITQVMSELTDFEEEASEITVNEADIHDLDKYKLYKGLFEAKTVIFNLFKGTEQRNATEVMAIFDKALAPIRFSDKLTYDDLVELVTEIYKIIENLGTIKQNSTVHYMLKAAMKKLSSNESQN